MSTQLVWYDVALRLALTVAAGAVVGLDRGVHGRSAGLRTTMLVCLAASVAMIQANLMLATSGSAADSFVKLDFMRLPLGVLTGMGFIGGGAILRRGDAVLGVTTAATLWFVTILGLCFGGGQHALGLSALAIGMLVLSSLKRWEAHILQTNRGVLTVTTTLDRPADDEFHNAIHAKGFRIASMEVRHDKVDERRTLRCELHWRASESQPAPIPIRDWAELPGVLKLQWTPSQIA